MKAGLRCVTNSCMLMTYGARQRHSEGRAPQPCASSAAAVRSTARCRRTLGARLCHISAASVPLSATSATAETTSRHQRAQVGIHSEAAAQFDPTGAVVRICQKTLDQRCGQPRAARVAATKARSWLSRSRLHDALFSGSIVSIGCCQKSWPKPIRFWCRINVSRSQPQSPPASRKSRR